MLRAILNKSGQQHPTKHQLYSHLPPITKTIQVRQTRHAGHCWRSRDELISDVLLWTPTYGRAKAGWPAQTYIQQLCMDTGCSPEDLPEPMNDREKWRERVRDIHASVMMMMMMMICIYIRGSLNKFPDFFCMALLLTVHTWNSCPHRSNLVQLKGPMEVLLCECVNDLHHSLFHLNCLIMTASELRE